MPNQEPPETKTRSQKSSQQKFEPSMIQYVRMRKLHELFLEQWNDPNRRFRTQEQLAKWLEVSPKTIQRDTEFMRDQLGLPVETIRARGGYGYTEEVKQFPMLSISEGELLALCLACKAMRAHRNVPHSDKLRTAFAKLAGELDFAVDLEAPDEVIDFRSGMSEAPVDLATFDMLARAALERKEVKIGYRKLGGPERPELRTVAPLRVVWISGAWYLFSYDAAADDIREFALVRMQGAEPTNRTFKLPRNFDLDARLDDSFGAHTSGKPVRVRLRFSSVAARLVSERQWHRTQEIVPVKESGADADEIELTMSVPESPELLRWVLGWDAQVRVMEPKSLREAVVRKAKAIQERYLER
jgi:proteasome accessory factor B